MGEEQKVSSGRTLTLEITPRNREAIKPAELIQVSGHHELTLNARRGHCHVVWGPSKFDREAEFA